MNWGKGIVTGMALFMLFIISMCVYMFRMPADEYDHHYYEKGLNFDRDYSKETQVIKDNACPEIRIAGKEITIAFTDAATGSVKFIRPSSQALDQTFNISTGRVKSARLAADMLVKGRWHMVLDWQSKGKAYLYEQEVDLQ